MAETAYGITFATSSDGSTYTSLGELTDITPPSITKDVIETTNHGSSGTKTYIGGLVDFGEASVTINYDPDGADDTAVRDLAKTSGDSATQYFKITYADAGTNTEIWQGLVTSFEQETPIDGQLSATFTIKVSGAITYSA